MVVVLEFYVRVSRRYVVVQFVGQAAPEAPAIAATEAAEQMVQNPVVVKSPRLVKAFITMIALVPTGGKTKKKGIELRENTLACNFKSHFFFPSGPLTTVLLILFPCFLGRPGPLFRGIPLSSHSSSSGVSSSSSSSSSSLECSESLQLPAIP